jgi:hypothetical protein
LYLGRTVGAVPTMCVAKVLLFSPEQTPQLHFMLYRCGNMLSANVV